MSAWAGQDRWAWLPLLLGAAIGVHLAQGCPPPAAARDGVEERLALAVAKVAVNEANFESPADVALVYQCTEAHGDAPGEQLAWLRSHSARVLGDRECREGRNCRWSRGLTLAATRPPGWPEGVRWRPAAWRRVLRLARRLVGGEEQRRPCIGRPVTWGGDMDHAEALRRGLRPLHCAGTRNTGYGVAVGGQS